MNWQFIAYTALLAFLLVTIFMCAELLDSAIKSMFGAKQNGDDGEEE